MIENTLKRLAKRRCPTPPCFQGDATKAKARSTLTDVDIEDATGMQVTKDGEDKMYSMGPFDITTTDRTTGNAATAGTYRAVGKSKKYGERFRKEK